jgi:hypothetical protein
MECFFPKMADPTPEAEPSSREEILWEPITEVEIGKALKAAKGTTAPGEDGLPMLVWKKTWTYVSGIVAQIFTASITLGCYPYLYRKLLKSRCCSRVNVDVLCQDSVYQSDCRDLFGLAFWRWKRYGKK